MVTGSGLLATSLLVVPLVLLPSFSSTLSTTPVPVLPMTPSHPRVEELVNSTAWWMSTERPSLPMVLPVSTVDSSPQSLESSCTVVSTSVSTIRSVSCFMCFVLCFLLSNNFCRACRSRRCPRRIFPCFVRSRMGCHHWCWSCFLPSRYHPVCSFTLIFFIMNSFPK